MFLKFIRTAAKGAAQYRHIADHYYCRLMTRYGNAAFKTILTHWDCSTSPNVAKGRARSASNDCRATRSLFS